MPLESCPPNDDKGTEDGIKAAVRATLQLKDLHCPVCSCSLKVGGMRLRTATGFSKIMCKDPVCSHVAYSNQWRCRCRLLWTRCPRHVHVYTGRISRTNGPPSLKKQREAVYGVVKPLPTSRCNGTQEEEDDFTELSDDELLRPALQLSGTNVSSMNEAAIRSRVHIIRAALSPANSFERFKVSFMNSSASEAVKARFARLTNCLLYTSDAADE